MPTYEYRCKTCGEHLEVVQSFTDDALTDCPACGADGQLRKVFGNIGITFKGSGFYKTDSRSGAGRSASGGSSDTKSDTAAGSTSSDGGSTSSTSSTSSGSGSSGDSSSTSSSATSAA